MLSDWCYRSFAMYCTAYVCWHCHIVGDNHTCYQLVCLLGLGWDGTRDAYNLSPPLSDVQTAKERYHLLVQLFTLNLR